MDVLVSYASAWEAKGQSPVALANYLRDLKRFCLQLGKPLEEATRTDVERHVTERLKVSPHVAFTSWKALRSFYAWLADADEVPNVAAKVPPPKVPEPVPTAVTEEDFAKLMLAIERGRPGRVAEEPRWLRTRDKALISVLWDTGVRRGELVRMTVADVDFDTRSIILPRTKNGKARRVYFDKDTAALLTRYVRMRSKLKHADQPELWIGHKGALTADGVRLALKDRCEAAGVSVSAHDFRRGMAITWLRQGGSQSALQTVAGWSTSAMVTRYTRAAAGDIAQAEWERMQKLR